jgi:hypothetical protein
MMERYLVTEKEQCRLLSCSRTFLRDLRSKRPIPFIRLGNKWIRYNPLKVAAAMEKLTIKERV